MTNHRHVGARLNLPRDLHAAYLIGRMGLVTARDVMPIFWSSASSARWGLLRLTKLGILRTFPRPAVSSPNWYSLTDEGLAWVLEQTGCDAEDLRAAKGIARVNLMAVASRNAFWTSLILASRASAAFMLDTFAPERELRRLKTDAVAVVPDAMVVLSRRDQAQVRGAFMVEHDAGTERTLELQKKARGYIAARTGASLYGHFSWMALYLVPSVPRARSVAAAVVRGGAGACSLIATAGSLGGGYAFAPVLWLAAELATTPTSPPSRSLLEFLRHPQQRPPTAVVGTSPSERRVVSR